MSSIGYSEVEPYSTFVAASPKQLKILLSTDQQPAAGLPPRPRHVTCIDELKSLLQPLPFFPKSGELLKSPGTLGPQSEEPYVWIDMRMPTEAERAEVLSWLPVHVLTRRNVLKWAATDCLEYFPSQGYVFMSVTARQRPGSDEDPVVIIAILFDHVLVTFRSGAFPGEEDVGLNATSDAMRSGARMGVPTLFSSLVSAVVLHIQSGAAGLLIEVDQLDELVLQVMPSKVDQDDLLSRIREMRGRVARFHKDMLLKERLLKQLLMPVLRETVVCRDILAVERYHRCLTLVRSAVEKLRKGRDTVNSSSMNLISGVSARLVQHCHWMDYLNHVQSQISLVVMPVAVIPGVWATNISVPFQNVASTLPFTLICVVTMSILLLGLVFPAFQYFKYKPPGALVPALD